jgi:hypothetical protein
MPFVNVSSLKTASGFGVTVLENCVSIASGTNGVGVMVGVSVTDGVLVMVGVRVILGVSVMVGVRVIVGVMVTVAVGGK